MTIDWAHFTPWSSLAGGALIGVATGLFILFNGRIAGISGILGGFLRPPAGKSNERAWRAIFIAGLLCAPLAWSLFFPAREIRVDAGWVQLVIAGLLVGVGTRYAAGCTSGHGVCGLSRLSIRSLAATLIFMAAGFATVFVVRHWLGAA
jgi:uncharacterized membrane protein YedE/YeeE